MLLKKLTRIHDTGYALCDFAERNVLRRDDGNGSSDFVLIDLENVQDNHTCLYENTYNFSKAQEDSLTLQCPGLMSAASTMRFWNASKLLQLALAVHLYSNTFSPLSVGFIYADGSTYLKSDGIHTDPGVLEALKLGKLAEPKPRWKRVYYQIAQFRLDQGE